MTALTVGMQATVQRVIDQALIDEYARLCDDQPQKTVPEPLIGALFSHVLGVKLPGAGAVYLRQEFTFHSTARVGEMLTATVTITHIRTDKPLITLRTQCTGSDQRLIVDGEALVMVPQA
ncbi:hypothetical protein [Chloroflexus sp.]|uniref:hypothetical protein n=1 Tax=Chloroflexus sp. TaxID=1904827 RepID=UPI00404B215F